MSCTSIRGLKVQIFRGLVHIVANSTIRTDRPRLVFAAHAVSHFIEAGIPGRTEKIGRYRVEKHEQRQ